MYTLENACRVDKRVCTSVIHLCVHVSSRRMQDMHDEWYVSRTCMKCCMQCVEISNPTSDAHVRSAIAARHARPISLLRLSLLRLLDSDFPGNSLWAWEFQPFNIKILLESTPLRSTILVQRLAANYRYRWLWKTTMESRILVRRLAVMLLLLIVILLLLPLLLLLRLYHYYKNH